MRHWFAFACMSLASVVACASDSLIPAALPDDERIYWNLDLNHQAILLSLAPGYDTATLVATPVNFRDEPLEGPSGRTVYTSNDPDVVSIGPDGRLVARKTTAQVIPITASLTLDNLRHSSTAFVRVVNAASPPVLETFSIDPVAPDSAKVAMPSNSSFGFTDTLHVRAADTAGDPMLDVPVYFKSMDSTIAWVRALTGEVIGRVRVGQTTIIASTLAFGVARADTLEYRIGWPVLSVIGVIENTESRVWRVTFPEQVIGVGGYIMFEFGYHGASNPDATFDLVFADPANAGMVGTSGPAFDNLSRLGYDFFCLMGSFVCESDGNAVLDKEHPFVLRHFPVAGTYDWFSPNLEVGGRVIVRKD